MGYLNKGRALIAKLIQLLDLDHWLCSHCVLEEKLSVAKDAERSKRLANVLRRLEDRHIYNEEVLDDELCDSMTEDVHSNHLMALTSIFN